jgi:hypothetical protein
MSRCASLSYGDRNTAPPQLRERLRVALGLKQAPAVREVERHELALFALAGGADGALHPRQRGRVHCGLEALQPTWHRVGGAARIEIAVHRREPPREILLARAFLRRPRGLQRGPEHVVRVVVGRIAAHRLAQTR